MYLWVVIATFITILLSYNLSVRPDMDRAYAETRASVAIAKFRALHNGVKDYLNSQAPEKTGQTRVTYYPGTGVNVSTPEGSQASSLTDEDIRNYLPVGYIKADETLDDIANITGGGKIVSKVFALTRAKPMYNALPKLKAVAAMNVLPMTIVPVYMLFRLHKCLQGGLIKFPICRMPI